MVKQKKRILMIATGGTIASKSGGDVYKRQKHYFRKNGISQKLDIHYPVKMLICQKILKEADGIVVCPYILSTRSPAA